MTVNDLNHLATRLRAGTRDTTWMRQAACRGLDHDLFFPDQYESYSKCRRGAKQVCDSCPVQPECLHYAMSTPVELHGIWGGLSPKERRKLRRQRPKRTRSYSE